MNTTTAKHLSPLNNTKPDTFSTRLAGVEHEALVATL